MINSIMKKPIDFYNNIIDNLADGRVYDALQLIKEQLSILQDWPTMDECQKIGETYGLMLKYFAEGMQDSGRDEVYIKLLRQILAIADFVKYQRGIMDSSNPYYQKARTLSKSSRTLYYYIRKIESASRQDLFSSIVDEGAEPNADAIRRLYEDLFDAIWVKTTLTEDDKKVLADFLESKEQNPDKRSWMISALTMSALYYYDEAKLELLVNNINSGIYQVQMRAIVGLSLIAMYYKKRFEIDAPHALLDFIPGLSSTWAMLQVLYYNTYNTKRVRLQIENDLMPMFFELQGKVDPERLQNILEDETPELPPDIDPALVNRLQGKIRSISEQLENGLDMYYSNFARLKNTSFFQEVHNWFKPFVTYDNSRFDADAKLLPGGAMLKLCDSDMYSLLETMSMLPDNMKQMIKSQIEDAKEAYGNGVGRDFNNMYADLQFSEKPEECLRYALYYLQNLYRFFEIKIPRDTEGNPFQAVPDLIFIDSPLIQTRVLPEDYMTVAMEAYNQKLYRHALCLMDCWSMSEELTDSECLICGFSHAMLREYESAIDFFEEIIAHGSASEDVLVLYANCLSATGNYTKAVAVYESLENAGYESLNLYSYAVALSHAGEYERAADILFKEDYLHPGQANVERLLAWCSLKAGNAEQALKYYEKRLGDSSAIPADFFHAGHAALALGDVARAVGLYKTYSSYHPNTHYTLFTSEDVDLLESLQVPVPSIRFVSEAVMHL